MNQRSEDPNKNIDIGTKGVSNLSGTQNLGGSANMGDPSDIVGGMAGTNNMGGVTDLGGSNDRSQGGYLRSDLFKQSKDQNFSSPGTQENKSGRSIS